MVLDNYCLHVVVQRTLLLFGCAVDVLLMLLMWKWPPRQNVKSLKSLPNPYHPPAYTSLPISQTMPFSTDPVGFIGLGIMGKGELLDVAWTLHGGMRGLERPLIHDLLL